MHIKPYLSWTQLDMLEKSEEAYIRAYFENKKIPINRGMALGKEVATSLEFGEDTGDIAKDFIISQIPKFEIMEYEIKTEILVNNVSVPIFSKLDTATTDLSAFKEIKTGVTKWDQKKADEHGQITFYCVGILELTKKIPKDIELVYVPSQKNPDGTLELTGEIIKFNTTRSMADILKMKIRMKKAWERIEQLTEQYFL